MMAGKLAGVTVNVLHVGVSVNCAVAIQPLASVTLMVNARAVVAVGVPLNKPLLDNVKPAGSVPTETLHVVAPVAPVTVSCCE